MQALYTIREVARLTGAPTEQLRRWDRSGLLPAVRVDDRALAYRFQDVIAARTALGLIEKGLTTRQVREAVEAIRAWRPDVDHPLAALRVFSDQGRLVVRLDERLVEPRSGQLLLALPIGDLKEAMQREAEVVHVEASRESRPPGEPTDAQGWVAAGLEAEDAGQHLDAIEHYRHALEIEPDHPGALLNLGNMVYLSGDHLQARDLYRLATRAAPDYPDAWYNLANVLDDLGHPDAAVGAYQTALELAPEYADAHFNLALVWEREGHRDRARLHWRHYLVLDSDSASAEIARRFLSE